MNKEWMRKDENGWMRKDGGKINEKGRINDEWERMEER